MSNFIAQLNQMLMSTDEDSWLAGLCDLLRTYVEAWVYITGQDGKVIAEALPLSGIRPDNPQYTISKPVITGETVLGYISVCRDSGAFTQDEEQLIDISICICIAHLHHLDKQRLLQRKKRCEAVREAINALSFSELEAAIYISQAITGLEGRLIAGHVADGLGFTRSIVVTALKKLEGAGVIEARSLGVKGTYIRIKEPLLVEELGKLGVGRKL